MNTLPVVHREMSCAANRQGTYWVRSGVALVALGGFVTVYLFGPPSPTEKGMFLLATLGIIALLLSLLSGVFLTADCLSREKREGTLGLLFLTSLRPHDVVLGKMAAGSATAFFALLSLLPVLCLPLLSGGVTVAETLRVMLVLFLTLLLSLSWGMLMSALAHESRTAFVATLIGLVLLAGLPILMAVFDPVATTRFPEALLLGVSPAYALIVAFEPVYGRVGADLYWTSTALVGLQIVAYLGAATWTARFSWRTEQELQPGRQRVLGRGLGPGARQRLASEAQVPGQGGPYYWVCRRGPTFGPLARWFFAGLILLWLYMMHLAATTRFWEEGFVTAFCLAFGLHTMMNFRLAQEATRQEHHDARGGELELLLVTPLGENAIVDGHVRAVRERFQRPLLLLGGLNTVMVVATIIFYDHLRMRGGAFEVFAVFFVGGGVSLLINYWAIPWIGLWKALVQPSHLGATFATLAVILGVPWLVGPVLFAVAVSGRHETEALCFLGVLWFVLGAILNLVWRQRARATLAQLRKLVAEGK